jgi:long-chain acyl-CoA synthetase
MSQQTIHQLFRDVASKNSAKTAYQHKQDGHWIDVTWSEVRADVAKISKSLMALGVDKGDRVSILSQTRLEWVLCDFGIVSCGGVTVGIYPSNLAPDCAYVIDHSDSEIIFVEDPPQLEKVLSVRSDLPKLRKLVIWDGAGDPQHDVLSWSEFLDAGRGVTDEQLEQRGSSVGSEDLASLVYTSGTTGVPKGVMLTNQNLVFTSDSARQSIHIEPGYTTLLFLPLAHVFARLIAYACMSAAVTVAFAEEIAKVADNLKEVRPHFMPSVPRLYEKIYDKILSGVEEAGGVKQKLFNWSVGVGRQVSQLQQSKQPIPTLLGLKHAVADKLVLHKIQAALGGRLVFAISGAAPLNKTIAEFFHACGVTILEGLGMTENTSFSHVNRFNHNKFGTVGQPGPGCDVKLADDGEVLFHGKNVMRGYFKDPDSTAETFDNDGWLLSGDIGEIDDEGFLRITDRKKDLIVTAGGKNVAPQRIERIIRTSHYISQVVAYGDKRKYITALISLEPDNIGEWAKQHGLGSKSPGELAREPEVSRLIEGEVEKLNGQLASFETIKRFHIVPTDFTVESGELTPTSKIKRKVVVERYAEQLEGLYD